MNKLEITSFPALDYAANEALNTLCTNLSYCGDNIQVVMFTSRYEQEGKSAITMNVMRSLASFGKRVVLVDSDLRCSILARRYRFAYETEKPMGLAQYLAGMCSLDDILYETDLPNAYVIPAGREVLNSMQLLTSPRYASMITALREMADMILIDTPPVGVIVDALELSKHSDGVVIIVEYNKGRKQEIGEIVDNLTSAGSKVLGAVMNGVDLDSFRNRRYYYRSERYSSYYRYSSNYHLTQKNHRKKSSRRKGWFRKK